MHAERDHLVTVVFPELRERLDRLGLDFYDVDLRWGVPETGVDGERANPWAYCKQWIERVEPFFISIIGQRYGWVPQGGEIEEEADRERWKNLSITEMEIRHAVLERKSLHRRSYFYLRKTKLPQPPVTSSRIYDEFVDTDRESDLARLKTLIRSVGRPVRDYTCEWISDHFENLDDFGRMVVEDLWSGILRDSRYVSLDTWREVLGHDPIEDPIYADESEPIPPELWFRIVENVRPAALAWRDAEAQQMAAFGANRLRWFHGRTNELDALQRFATTDGSDEPSRLLVVKAMPGQGKTALLARLADRLMRTDARVILHFVGATEGSASVRQLLSRLIREVDPNRADDDALEAMDLPDLQRLLADRLRDYSGPRRLILILDGINQLSSGHDLRWLPTQLGDGVRIIASCAEEPSALPNASSMRVLAALQARRPAPKWLPLGELNAADVQMIVKEYLEEYCKVLTQDSMDRICGIPQAKNPLYLMVMLEELRTLGGNDMNLVVPRLISEMELRYPDTISLFGWVLERLGVFGKRAVGLWCAYLALGRVGMSSGELRDLLERKLGKDGARAALRIERGLRRYLLHRGPRLDFFHGQLREAVRQRYLDSRVVAAIHADIADYFGERWAVPDVHAVSELPYHQKNGQQLEKLRALLWNAAFLQTKVEIAGPQPLIDDYDLVLGDAYGGELDHHGVERERLQLLQGAIRLSKHALGRDPHQLASQLHGRLSGVQDENGVFRTLLEQISIRQSRPWLRPLTGSLQSPDTALRLTFTGHSSWIRALALTRDGRRAVSASADGILKVWDLATGEEELTLARHAADVYAIAVTSDGRRAVSASQDRTLKVWDLQTGEHLRTLAGHSRAVTIVVSTPDGRRAVSASGWDDSRNSVAEHALKVWDLENGVDELTLAGHTETVLAVAITPDGRRAVSASADTTLKVWDLSSGKEELTLVGHSGWVKAVVVTPDGRRAVSASADKTLKIWDLASGREEHTLVGHFSGVLDVAVTPDGQRVVSASSDKRLKVWDLASGAEERTLVGHTGPVAKVVVTPDGRRAISASDDRTLRVWDLSSGEEQQSLSGHSYGVQGMAVTPEGRSVVSFSPDSLRVWDLAKPSRSRLHATHDDGVTAVAVTPDSRRAVTASSDKTLKVWNLTNGKEERTLIGHAGGIRAMVVTPDGLLAISASVDRTLRVWNLASGTEVQTLAGRSQRSIALVAREDGRLAVTESSDRTHAGHADGITAVAVTPDCSRVVSASSDHTLMIWDLASGEPIHSLIGHSQEVTAVVLTPDGCRAVSASADKKLKVWDIMSGKEERTFVGHREPIWIVVVTPDGQRAVSVSYEVVTR